MRLFKGSDILKNNSYHPEQTDSALVTKFLKEHKLEAWIMRVLKTKENGKDVFELRNAGIEKSVVKAKTDFEGADFMVTTGDFGPLLAEVNKELTKAMESASNENEKQMISNYIKSFEVGDVQFHKEGSKFWVKNKSPPVETYIGFIESYRDPAGSRSEFEGFVSMVNKEQSVKFQNLVSNAEVLLPRLPWPKGFEKDKFLR